MDEKDYDFTLLNGIKVKICDQIRDEFGQISCAKFEIFDKNGNSLFQNAQDAGNFDENFALVKMDDHFGLIDETGVWFFEPIYHYIGYFKGFFVLNLHGKFGLMRRDKTWAIEPVFGNFYACDGAFAAAKVIYEPIYGQIDENGNFIGEKFDFLPPEFKPLQKMHSLLNPLKMASKKPKIRTQKKIKNGEKGDESEFDDKFEDKEKDQRPYDRIYKIIRKNRSKPPKIAEFKYKKQKLGDKFGLVDRHGRWAIPALYDDICGYSGRGLIRVKIGDSWGFINKFGKTVIECKFEGISRFKKGVAIAQKNGKLGAINARGEWVIKPKFGLLWQLGQNRFCYSFSEKIRHTIKHRDKTHIAIISKTKFGLLDENGEEICKPKFGIISKFSANGFAIARKSLNYGILDINGDWKILPKFDEIIKFGKIYAFKDGEKIGFMGEMCEPLGKPFIGDLEYTYLANDLIIADGWDRIGILRDGKWLCYPEFSQIGTTGEDLEMIKNQKFEKKFEKNLIFKNGAAVARKGGNFVIINEFGESLSKDKFEYLRQLKFYKIFAVALKKREKLFSFIAQNGESVGNARFSWLKSPIKIPIDGQRKRFFRARLRGKTGILSKRGNWFIMPKYSEICDFDAAGCAMVKKLFSLGKTDFKNKKTRVRLPEFFVEEIGIEPEFIDKSGEAIVDFKKLKKLPSFRNSFITDDDKMVCLWKFGYINARGKEILKPSFDSVRKIGKNYIKFEIGGKFGLIRIDGEVICKPEFDEISPIDSPNFVAYAKLGKSLVFIEDASQKPQNLV